MHEHTTRAPPSQRTSEPAYGCPMHPDWLLLTLADAVAGATIAVDDYRRPAAIYAPQTVHASCVRRGAYDTAQRDGGFAEGHCMYSLGCKGPLAAADCAVRRWNGGQKQGDKNAEDGNDHQQLDQSERGTLGMSHGSAPYLISVSRWHSVRWTSSSG